MEKVKFGIQLIILMLAFPVWFVTEMRQADLEMKKNQSNKEEIIEVKKMKTGKALKKVSAVSDLSMMPGSTLIVVNI